MHLCIDRTSAVYRTLDIADILGRFEIYSTLDAALAAEHGRG